MHHLCTMASASSGGLNQRKPGALGSSSRPEDEPGMSHADSGMLRDPTRGKPKASATAACAAATHRPCPPPAFDRCHSLSRCSRRCQPRRQAAAAAAADRSRKGWPASSAACVAQPDWRCALAGTRGDTAGVNPAPSSHPPPAPSLPYGRPRQRSRCRSGAEGSCLAACSASACAPSHMVERSR